MSWHKIVFNEDEMTKEELKRNIFLLNEEIEEIERLTRESNLNAVRVYLIAKSRQLRKMKNIYINGLYSNE